MSEVSNDLRLLREYAENDSESAFTELVKRHVNLVYSAALRQVHDRHLAEDVSQGVFLILAKKAGSLKHETVLSAWLLRVTRYAAINALKAAGRRRKHERKAAEMNAAGAQPDSDWPAIAEVIDAAMSHLNAADQRVIALRFYEGRSMEEVAGVLGGTAEAARQRVHRALERLRTACQSRGAGISSAALGAALGANAIIPAPPSLAATAAATALAASAQFNIALIAKGAIAIMTWTKIKMGILAALIVLFLGGSALVLTRQSLRENHTAMAISPAAASQEMLLESPDTQQGATSFQRAYRLDPGEAVRHVALPFMKERHDFIRTMAGSRSAPAVRPEDGFAFIWNNEIRSVRGPLPSLTVAQFLDYCLDIPLYKLDVAADVAEMRLPGDWIISETADIDAKMKAVGVIFAEVLGIPLRLERSMVERDVIVVRGKLRNDQPPIELFGNTMTSRSEPLPGTLGELVIKLGEISRNYMVDETGAEQAKLQWRRHMRGKLPADQVDALFANVANQTALTFSAERRTVPIWSLQRP